MKIGLFGINFGLCGEVGAMVRVARHAEDGGLESLWTGEHVVLPDPQAPPSPAAPRTPFLLTHNSRLATTRNLTSRNSARHSTPGTLQPHAYMPRSRCTAATRSMASM